MNKKLVKLVKTISMALLMLISVFEYTVINVYAYSSTKNGASVTFEAEAAGATDINISSSEKLNVKIYDKNLFSKDLLHSFSGKKIPFTAKLSNNNKYYVEASTVSGKKADITCTIEQHLDKRTAISGAGGTWTVNGTSPVPSSVILYQEKIYFTAAQCSQAVTYASSAKFLDYQTALVNGTLGISSLVVGGVAGNTGIKALSVASFFFDVAVSGLSVNFKEDTIEEIKEKGGYNAKSNTFSNGVVLTIYMSQGMTFMDVDKWTGGTMTGEKGFIGTWSNYK